MARRELPSSHRRAARSFFVFGLLCFVCSHAPPARAQVNIEALRKQLSDKDFSARIRFSLTTYAGNTQGIIAGTSSLVGGRLDRNLLFSTVSADYARLNGATSVRKSFVHLRHNYELLREWLWWEEFAQSESDRFRRIQLRGLLGTGPRFRILKDKEWLDLFIGNSYMLEYTRVDPNVQATAPSVVHRLNNYLAVNLRPDERILLGTIVYYQPRLDQWSNAHALSVSSVEFKVTELLQSRMDLTVRYESHPPQGVKTTDVEFKSSLELKF